MSAPAKASVEQVLSAAADLRASGERVTGCSLRRVLGCGRPDRLMAIVEKHGLSSATAAQPAVPTLPLALTELVAALEQRVIAEVHSLADETWRRASDLASRRMEADIADSRSSLANTRIENVELNEALAIADVEKERLLQQIANLQDEVRDSREQLLAIRGTLTEVRDREREARDEIAAARRQTDHARATINEVLDACTSPRMAPEATTGSGTTIETSPGTGGQSRRPLRGIEVRPERRRTRMSKLIDRAGVLDGTSTLAATTQA